MARLSDAPVDLGALGQDRDLAAAALGLVSELASGAAATCPQACPHEARQTFCFVRMRRGGEVTADLAHASDALSAELRAQRALRVPVGWASAISSQGLEARQDQAQADPGGRDADGNAEQGKPERHRELGPSLFLGCGRLT
jgi:hypothetical protein